MRISSLLIVAGCALGAGVFAVVGCSTDDGTGTTSGTTSTSSSGESTSSSSSSGASSSSSSGASSSSSSGASSSSSSSSSASSSGYQSCGGCTSTDVGSPTKECKTQADACDGDQGCKDIKACSFACPAVDHAGGCCTLDCLKGAAQASVDLFKAIDNCIYCTTCKTICTDPPSYDATEYCKATSGAAACP